MLGYVFWHESLGSKRLVRAAAVTVPSRLLLHVGVLAAAALCAASLAAAGVPAAPPPSLTFEPIELDVPGGGKVPAERGRLRVLENRRRRNSRQITLAFVRLRSTSANPGHPIVYLAGGPGTSGIAAARSVRYPFFAALSDHADVIALDQRGAGESEPNLACSERYRVPFARPTVRARAARTMGRAAADCVRRLRAAGVDLDGYNTRESAADLDDLRRALGAEKVVLWGMSYGTHLALAAMREYPGSVDRVILAGVEGPDQTLKLPSNQQALLEEISRLASADAGVRRVVPDLVASLSRLLRRLEHAPQIVEGVHPTSGKPYRIEFGAFDLQIHLADLLRGPENFRLLPDMVARLERGDFFGPALRSVSRRSGGVPSAMLMAMDCASGASPARRRRIAEEARTALLGDAMNFPFPEICRAVDVEDLGEEFRRPVRSAVPALVISGTLDGRTPPANAEQVLEGLPNGIHILVDGAGHGDALFEGSPEILAAMRAFLRGERIASNRVAAPPVFFLSPRLAVALPEEVLARYVGTYRLPNGDVRRVFLVGPLLYTQRETRRGRGATFVIRAYSPTGFFYEGTMTRIEFEVDGEGSVTGMVMYREDAPDGERAIRVP